MCLYPKLVRNPKYKVNKKNGGNTPAISDKRALYVPIGCGQCIQCRRQKYLNWKIRLTEELKSNKECLFITLTFSPESLIRLLKDYGLKNECSAVAGKAIRLFLERYRKKYKHSLKHWFVTELGDNHSERLHIHGLIWNVEEKEKLEEIWSYGNVKVDKRPVTEKTIGYCAKYILKIDKKHKNFRSQTFCSGGLGKGYLGRYNSSLNRYRGKDTYESYRFDNGTEVNLPVYYRSKIYSDELYLPR